MKVVMNPSNRPQMPSFRDDWLALQDPAGRTGLPSLQSADSVKLSVALEGLLREVGQDGSQESLQYLERTKARQQGE